MGWIVGIHLGHDASVAVLRDGRPEWCAAEERFARRKMYYGFPFRSLEAALQKLRFSPGEVDAVALDTLELPRLLGPGEISRRFKRGFQKDFMARMARLERAVAYLFGIGATARRKAWEDEARRQLWDGLAKLGFPENRICVYDHHFCHAASAFWPSPFDRALVVTSDGRGDELSATVGLGDGGKLRRQLSVGDASSLGQFYAAVTSFLGFRPNLHEPACQLARLLRDVDQT